MGMVWDCDRSPSDAIAGVEWKLDNFKAPYDASLRDVPIDFGDKSDRYVQFDIEDWNSDLNPDYNYITDNSGNELVISLKLYEVDGTFVSIVSKYGDIQGLGKDAPGLFDEQEDHSGTLFTMESYSVGGSITYTPKTGVVENLSELGLVSGNSSIKTDDNKGLIIETSDKYKEGASGGTKNFDGTIHAGEIESLTIGTTTASTIDILIKETTVKTGGVTLVTDKTTATLTLSGANDLGPVTKNGLGVPYRFAVRTNPPMVKRHSMNPEITVAW